MFTIIFCFLLLPYSLAQGYSNSEPNSTLNCSLNCSGHGICQLDQTCQCNFGYSLQYCQQDWSQLYFVYVILFCILFAIIAIISFIQLIRFVSSDGYNITRGGIQKILHFQFFIMGLGRFFWLILDPHNLKNRLNPIVENLGNSFGIFVIVFSYALVVLLWATTYSKATVGKTQSPFFRVAKPVLISLIIFCGIFEVVLRVLWRQVDPFGSTYKIIIYTYYLFMMTTVSAIMAAFLFYGIRMYWNLAAFQGVNPLVRERLQRITSLTMGSTILSIITFVCVLGSLIAEVAIYKFDDMVFFLGEQYLFRFLEIVLVCFILYSLRRRTYDIGNLEEEKQKLLQNKQITRTESTLSQPLQETFLQRGYNYA